MKDRLLTPQQELFLSEYTNPKSPNFGNALQSALKAGYSREYSENITVKMPEWLVENVGMTKRLKKAEKNLDEILDLPNEKDFLPSKTKVTLFVAERIGKDKYSQRTEVTGKNGESIARSPMFEDLAIMNKVNEIESLIKDKLYAGKNKESNQDLASDKK